MPFQGGVWLDRSGTINEGSVSQLLMAASKRRLGLIIQNLSSEPLWINFNEEASEGEGSLRILPNGSYWEGIPGPTTSQAIHIIGPTTGQKFTAKEM